MLSRLLTTPRLRLGGVIISCAAMTAMGVVGCTSVTGGTPAANSEEAPAFRTSVSESVSASAATSSARETERQASLTTAAMQSSCETMSTTGPDAIAAVNDYVAARNANASQADVDARANTAVERLNTSADQVASSLTPGIPQEMVDALNRWVDAARGLANVISTRASIDDFNAAIDRLNEAKTQAVTLCDAAY